MQVPIGNQSRVNPDSYHTTRSLCDKHDRVSSLGNRTFRNTPRVSYTNVTKPFGSHRGTLTPMFQDFYLRGLTVPFLLYPTHIIYIYFYVLNPETSIGRRPKYELTTHSSTINRTSCQVPCNIYRKHISPIHFMPIFIDIVVSCILAFINT